MKSRVSLCKLCVTLIVIFFTSHAFSQTTFIPQTSTWKYLDDGSNQGTSWRDSGFNDASWASGSAVLGYGGINGNTVSTTVSYGPSSTNKYTTTYFRKEFTVSAAPYTYIYLNLLSDDGAVIYINGKEAYRYNMPSGTISYTTFASGAVSGSDEGDYTVYTVPDTFLVNGTNVVAVEVHQNNLTSSDLGFDLEVSAEFIDEIVSAGGSWNYLDDGSNQGTSWRDSGFNDASWSTGDAVLGYGTLDGNTVTTTVSYGGDANNKHQTTYFRKEFSISNPSFTHLDINLLADDGAIVYINGKEAVRYGMASGTVSYTDYATYTVGGTEEGDYTLYTVPDTFLVNGVNTIAVEIHQVNATSSDLGFDLSLAGKNVKIAYGRLYMDFNASGTYDDGDGNGSGAVEIMMFNDADSNGIYTAAEKIDSTLTDPLGYWTIQYSDTLRHIAFKLDINDVDAATILTTDTAFAFLTDTVTTDTVFAYFGMLGPRSICLLVADNQDNGDIDQYYMVNRLSGKNQWIAEITGITSIEAISVKLGLDTVWAFDAGQLGWLDLQTGAFNAVGSGLGDGDGLINGSSTTHTFVDIDGMAFDAVNDILYGTEKTTTGKDLLVAINRGSGTLIPDFFGAGVDFVTIRGTGVKDDVDDIAFNPITNELLAINNQSNGDSTRYISINVSTGVGTVISIAGIGDMEGMDYYNNGELYATTGIVAKTGYPANTFYSLDRATGIGTKVDSLRENANDVEACGCLTGPAANMITGVVFYDIDSSGTYNKAIDSIESSVIVYLYRDANGDGNIDAGDYVIDSAYSDGANGIYIFLIDSMGDFLMRPQINGTPLQNYNVTTNDSLKEEANFVNFGEVDGKNDFGFHISAGTQPVLPVTWLEVEAIWQEKDALVSWTTASEINNSHFEIERSFNGTDFETVGIVAAAEANAQLNTYTFTDLTIYMATKDFVYYRIKQIDNNGNHSYSSTAVLEKENFFTVLTWPNPFENEISISIDKNYNELELELIDITGASILQRSYSSSEKKTLTIANLNHLSHGVYYLRISKDDVVTVVKLIK